MRSKHTLIVLLFLTLWSTDTAWSGTVIEIFQRSNQPQICRVQNGVYMVDRAAVAAKMLEAASVGPDLLLLARQSGNRFDLVASDHPFGTGPGATTPEALAATQRLLSARMELTGFLALGGSKAQGYTVSLHNFAGAPTSDDFFLEPDAVNILCLRSAAPTPKQDASNKPNFAAAVLASRLLVRSEVSELTLGRDDIGEIKGTTFSFVSDQDDGGSDTTIADGVVGWRLLSINGEHSASVIPYFRYKVTGNDPENFSQFIEPGVLVDAFYNGDRVAATIGLTASRIMDNSDDSDQANLSAFIIPSFRVPFGERNIVLFGGYMNPIGPLSLRPELKLMAAGRQIENAGTNPALQGKDSYFGVGFNIRVDMLLVGVPLFQKLRGNVQYTRMENFNIQSVDLFKAGLMYPLLDSDRISLNFDYANGRDVETLLEDERYTLGLAFRY